MFLIIDSSQSQSIIGWFGSDELLLRKVILVAGWRPRARVMLATHDCSAILRSVGTPPAQHYAHLRLAPWRGPAQWDATR